MASCVRAFFLAAFVMSAILGSRSVAHSGEWYLMGPPNEADLDTSCDPDGSPAWHDYWTGLRTLETPGNARLKRCLTEFFVEQPTEPISRWIKLSGPAQGAWVTVYKNLDNCDMASEIGAGAPPRSLDPKVYDQVENATDSKKLHLYIRADPELKKFDEDPMFKKDPRDWNDEEREKWRKAWGDFQSRHPDNPFFALMLQPGHRPWDPPESKELCIATDDPRLKEQ